MLRSRILFFITLFITSSRILATDYYLYYLGGQSNMDGYGYVNELPDSLNEPNNDDMIFHGNPAPDDVESPDGKGIWSVLRPGHGVGFSSDGSENSYSDRFGPELTFARQLSHLYPDRHIAIIKYSRGGTAIDCEAAGQFGCWDPDFEGKTGINQYDHFLATLRLAMSVEDIDGDREKDRLIPAGILWMQGESDASYTEEIALRYYDHLKRLMDLIRAALQHDDLPVVVGKISDSWNDEEDQKVWDHGELVQYAEEKYCRTDPQAAIVKSTRYYSYSDPWHYDSEGYVDLGRKFAEAMKRLE